MTKGLFESSIEDYCNGKTSSEVKEKFKKLIKEFYKTNKDIDESEILDKFIKENSDAINLMRERNKIKYLYENYISLMWLRVVAILMLVSTIICVIAILSSSGHKY